MNNNFINPFSVDRAEHLGKDLFKFYVNHQKFHGILKRKSLIVTGGRGCGKTMFFLYNTYFQKKLEFENISTDLNYHKFLLSEERISIYFRADSDLVTAFNLKGKDLAEWEELFAHYFNLTICKRFCEVAIDINKIYKNKFEHEEQTCLETSILLDLSKTPKSYSELLKELSVAELLLIRYVSNNKKYERPILVVNGQLFNTLINGLLKEDILQNKSFHVFVDEYENLLIYQQKLINTLIKHPNPTIINAGMRKEGLRTYQTLSPDEAINFPHDYDIFDFEDFSHSDYEQLIIDSCRRRFKSIPQLRNEQEDSKYLDIGFYLGKYDAVEEAKSLYSKKAKSEIESKIKAFLGGIENPDEKERIFRILSQNGNPIINRLNLVLLNRNKFAPRELASQVTEFLNKNNRTYQELINNNSLGIVFLLCKDSKRKKKYYGFSPYLLLSSGIIRYFHELCETAFTNASRNGFSFDSPRPLNEEEQSSAAYHVSEYKVNDIDTYAPFSNSLKRFILHLGSIFNSIHKNEKLSEPEKNHFSTDYFNLCEHSKNVIKSAKMWCVLQERSETKEKSDKVSINQYEYHLNHIYAPYFGISYRRKKKLDLKSEEVDMLIGEESDKASNVAKEIIKRVSDSQVIISFGKQLSLDDINQ